MSQHDFEIANQTASSARDDINNALVALATNSSGINAPSSPEPNMFWYEEDTNILKIRNLANTAWINFAYVDATNSRVGPMDNTYLYNSGGTQTGLLGDQATSTWQTGTGTLDSLVSPAQVKASVLYNTPDSIGVAQTWQDMSGSRVVGTSYQNTTGRPIMVSICTYSTARTNFQVSTNNSTWISVGALAGYGNLGDEKSSQVIVPDDHYYKATGGSLRIWAELR